MIFSKKATDSCLDANSMELEKLKRDIEMLRKQLGEHQAALASLKEDVKALNVRMNQGGANGGIPVTPKEDQEDAECSLDANAVPQAQCAHEPGGPLCLYLPAPNPDGFFASYSTVKQVGKSIYKLMLTDADNGRFEVLDDEDAMATATISISQFVKPVCRIEGDVRLRPRTLVTIEPGMVSREGKGWRVVKKAKIELLR